MWRTTTMTKLEPTDAQINAALLDMVRDETIRVFWEREGGVIFVLNEPEAIENFLVRHPGYGELSLEAFEKVVEVAAKWGEDVR
jgi:hypothetical protein